ncbi:hypothetical protein M885DRAFT_512695 [Pelagophyceae sp. CCMP2097]|nr:hypothetical protein M885DRAFT_512695 [Pelagophyceae sp. CCMP2097]
MVFAGSPRSLWMLGAAGFLEGPSLDFAPSPRFAALVAFLSGEEAGEEAGATEYVLSPLGKGRRTASVIQRAARSYIARKRAAIAAIPPADDAAVEPDAAPSPLEVSLEAPPDEARPEERPRPLEETRAPLSAAAAPAGPERSASQFFDYVGDALLRRSSSGETFGELEPRLSRSATPRFADGLVTFHLIRKTSAFQFRFELQRDGALIFFAKRSKNSNRFDLFLGDGAKAGHVRAISRRKHAFSVLHDSRPAGKACVATFVRPRSRKDYRGPLQVGCILSSTPRSDESAAPVAAGDDVVVRQRLPRFDAQKNVSKLNFGRGVAVVTSIKNFQMVVGRIADAPTAEIADATDADAVAAGDGDYDDCETVDDGGAIVLQHRKVGDDAFDLDVAEPLSPFVAFALVLAHSFGPN